MCNHKWTETQTVWPDMGPDEVWCVWCKVVADFAPEEIPEVQPDDSWTFGRDGEVEF